MDDHDYFGRRAGEERKVANEAASSLARDAHLKMAHNYDQLARLRAGSVAPLIPSQGE